MKELKHTNLKEKYASLEPSNVEDNKIEVQYADEYGAIFLVNFNNERESNDKNNIKKASKKS